MQITIDLPQDIQLDDAIRQQAESKARESYIMELLRHGSISTGYAAQSLNLSRLEIFELMGQYKISTFPEQSPEELAQEVAETRHSIQP
jgi:predicted HTH domain antitoxin